MKGVPTMTKAKQEKTNTESGAYTFANVGFSYVAVWPNRAYGAMTPATDPRPSVRHGNPKPVASAAAASSLTIPSVVAASVAIVAAVAMLACALYFTALTPSAVAEQRTHGAPGAAYETSTPIAEWEQGSYPHLYQNNEAWGYAPFGSSTVAEAGSAPTSLCMAYAYLTGDHAYTPAGFAAYGNEQGLTEADTATTVSYLTSAADAFGLSAVPIDADALSLRQALGQGASIVAVMPVTGKGNATISLVVEGIDADSQLSVLNPASAEHVPETWSFEELLQSTSALVSIVSA